jgi:hypothetical protein
MRVDLLVVKKGWWPKAWGFIFSDKDSVTVIIESPYNPYARGEIRSDGLWELWENQRMEIWTLEKVLKFLQTLDSLAEEDEVEVAIAEDIFNEEIAKCVSGLQIRWWTTGYQIYM